MTRTEASRIGHHARNLYASVECFMDQPRDVGSLVRNYERIHGRAMPDHLLDNVIGLASRTRALLP